MLTPLRIFECHTAKYLPSLKTYLSQSTCSIDMIEKFLDRHDKNVIHLKKHKGAYILWSAYHCPCWADSVRQEDPY